MYPLVECSVGSQTEMVHLFSDILGFGNYQHFSLSKYQMPVSDRIDFFVFQLLSRYDDPVTDYEEDLTTSNENSFGRKRKTR